MTRSVADAAAILRTIAGFDPNDPTTRRETVRDYMDTVYNGAQGLQIGVDEAYCTKGVDPVVRSAVLATVDVFRDLGAEIHEVDVSQINDATPSGMPCARQRRRRRTRRPFRLGRMNTDPRSGLFWKTESTSPAPTTSKRISPASRPVG